jgi:hypothetical protein
MIVARSSADTARRRRSTVAGLDLPQPRQRRKLLADLGHRGAVGVGLYEAGDRPGIGQDPRHLFGTGRLVDRHGHRAGRPDRVVDERPLVPGLAHQGDPVAGLDPAGDQAAGQRDHLMVELGAGHVVPVRVRAAAAAGELDDLREPGGVVPHRIGQIRGIADGRHRRHGELAHVDSSRLCN